MHPIGFPADCTPLYNHANSHLSPCCIIQESKDPLSFTITDVHKNVISPAIVAANLAKQPRLQFEVTELKVGDKSFEAALRRLKVSWIPVKKPTGESFDGFIAVSLEGKEPLPFFQR